MPEVLQILYTFRHALQIQFKRNEKTKTNKNQLIQSHNLQKKKIKNTR
jgi:hypothetical protein